MRLRSIFLVLALLLVAVFAAANWSAFTTPTRLSLLVATIEAPLGLLMLGLLGLAVLSFFAYIAAARGEMLVQTRRQMKELQSLRDLADNAEASRFAELRSALRDECARMAQRVDDVRDAVRTDVREGTNSVAAMLGELSDRLDRSPPQRLEGPREQS